MTTVTAVTDFGIYDFFAIVADLTGVTAQDTSGTRTLIENSDVSGEFTV